MEVESSSTIAKEVSSEIVYVKEPELVKEPAKLPAYIPNLDVCFMLDCTGSMQSHIDRARNKIKDIIEEVKQQYPESEIQVGIVGYRDISDSKRFEIFPFTSNIQSARDFLDRIKADGGGDCPEDVNGGFQQVLKQLDWQGQARMIIHIADAPCHGKAFHTTSDSYPDGYKDDMPWDTIFQQIVEQHMDYLFLKIFDLTDKMFEKFKEMAEKHGATEKGVLFKQESISNTNSNKAVPTTTFLSSAPMMPTTTTTVMPTITTPAVTIERKKRGPRKYSKKDKEVSKTRKEHTPKSRSRKSKVTRGKSESTKRGSSEEEEETDTTWTQPVYWTRSKYREWKEKESPSTIDKKDTSRSRKGDLNLGGNYWTIPDTPIGLKEKEEGTKPRTRRRGRGRPSKSKEAERSESRDRTKSKKVTTRNKRNKSKKEMEIEKPTDDKKTAKRAFISPRKRSSSKHETKRVPMPMPMCGVPIHLPPGMSALEEQEYFAKLLSTEMAGSIHRKIDAKK